MSKYIKPWLPLLFCSAQPTAFTARMPSDHMDTAQPSELACMPQEPQSHNEAQDLLLLQDYVANCRIPNGHWRHLCLIAANRTSCRRNQRARLQSHTHGLLLPKESAHPCRSSSQCNRTCSYKPTAAAHASEHITLPTEDLNTADTSCPSRPRLNTSIPDLVPIQRMNARIPVPMWLSQQHGQPTASNTIGCNACIC